VSGLTKSQLAALLDVTKSNPEFALQQAFRFGLASLSDDSTPAAIKRASEILEHDAESIRQAFDGSMTSEAKEDYAERKKVAKQLRDLISEAPKKVGKEQAK
jgi:hypothetical protein